MLVTATDISSFKESENHLKEVNQRLLAVFDQTEQKLWEVDISSGILTVFGRNEKMQIKEKTKMRFPEQLIENGWVHPISASHFRKFAEELMQGSIQGYGNFLLLYLGLGCYGWAAVSYRMIFDEIGHAVKAVGVDVYKRQR